MNCTINEPVFCKHGDGVVIIGSIAHRQPAEWDLLGELGSVTGRIGQ